MIPQKRMTFAALPLGTEVCREAMSLPLNLTLHDDEGRIFRVMQWESRFNQTESVTIQAHLEPEVVDPDSPGPKGKPEKEYIIGRGPPHPVGAPVKKKLGPIQVGNRVFLNKDGKEISADELTEEDVVLITEKKIKEVRENPSIPIHESDVPDFAWTAHGYDERVESHDHDPEEVMTNRVTELSKELQFFMLNRIELAASNETQLINSGLLDRALNLLLKTAHSVRGVTIAGVLYDEMLARGWNLNGVIRSKETE
tara:strand:+ start:422 stop:1186 length:765 start_codon:yes stop_codon:yes gene_type:complete